MINIANDCTNEQKIVTIVTIVHSDLRHIMNLLWSGGNKNYFPLMRERFLNDENE